MTWVNTPPKVYKEPAEGEEAEEIPEGEGEEDGEPQPEEGDEVSEPEEEKLDENGEPIVKPKILYYKEKDYYLRVPHQNFQ